MEGMLSFLPACRNGSRRPFLDKRFYPKKRRRQVEAGIQEILKNSRTGYRFLPV
jgi:hypothetical protein